MTSILHSRNNEFTAQHHNPLLNLFSVFFVPHTLFNIGNRNRWMDSRLSFSPLVIWIGCILFSHFEYHRITDLNRFSFVRRWIPDMEWRKIHHIRTTFGPHFIFFFINFATCWARKSALVLTRISYVLSFLLGIFLFFLFSIFIWFVWCCDMSMIIIFFQILTADFNFFFSVFSLEIEAKYHFKLFNRCKMRYTPHECSSNLRGCFVLNIQIICWFQRQHFFKGFDNFEL